MPSVEPPGHRLSSALNQRWVTHPLPHFMGGKLRHGVSHAARITRQCPKSWMRVVSRGLAPKHKKPTASLLDVSKGVMEQPTLPHPWALPMPSGATSWDSHSHQAPIPTP